MKKKIQVIVLLFVLVVIGVPSALALGLGADYLADNTMVMHPGEVRLYKVNVQNGGGDLVKVGFSVDSPIVTVVEPKDFYEVGPGNIKQFITLKITVPNDAVSGKEYKVVYGLAPIQRNEESVPLSLTFKSDFTVKVKEKPVVADDKKKVNTGETINTKVERKTQNKVVSPPYNVLVAIIAIIVIVIFLLGRTHRVNEGKGLKKKKGSKR